MARRLLGQHKEVVRATQGGCQGKEVVRKTSRVTRSLLGQHKEVVRATLVSPRFILVLKVFLKL